MIDANILIVEDDYYFAVDLERVLADIGYLQVKIIPNSEEAFKIIRSGWPDLVILDIQLEGKWDGIELAEKFMDDNIPFIFLTVLNDQDTYYKSRKTAPYVYLVKPVNKIVLQSAMESALLPWRMKKSPSQKKNKHVDRDIYVKTGNKLIRIEISTIQYVEVEGNYCNIFSNEKKVTISMSLKKLIPLLPAEEFIQVHRNYLIQLSAIESVSLDDNAVVVVGELIPIGVSFRSTFMKTITKL